MEKLGQTALEGNDPSGNDVATTLCKFSVVHRDIAVMTKQLVRILNHFLKFGYS